MQAVARQVQSEGDRTVKISILPEKAEVNVRSEQMSSKQVQEFMRIAERWTIPNAGRAF